MRDSVSVAGGVVSVMGFLHVRSHVCVSFVLCFVSRSVDISGFLLCTYPNAPYHMPVIGTCGVGGRWSWHLAAFGRRW